MSDLGVFAITQPDHGKWEKREKEEAVHIGRRTRTRRYNKKLGSFILASEKEGRVAGNLNGPIACERKEKNACSFPIKMSGTIMRHFGLAANVCFCLLSAFVLHQTNIKVR